MEWCKITITAEQASNKFREIQGEFIKILQTVRDVKGIAVFSGGRSQDNEFNVYFTPQCAENHLFKTLIDSYGGIPCDKPTKEDENEMRALFSSDDTWNDMIWHPYL